MNNGPCISVVTKNLKNPAYIGARLGVERVLSQYGSKATHLIPTSPDSISEQSELLLRALADRPDAILLAPAHARQMRTVLDQVAASSIPLFCFVSEPVPSVATTFVGANDYALGSVMAGYLGKFLKGFGEIIIVNGHPDAATTRPRALGYKHGLREFPNVFVRKQCQGDYQRETAKSVFKKIIDEVGVPDGVLVSNDFMACGIWDVIQFRGLSIPMVGANATPEGAELIKQGAMLASAAFDAMSMGGLAAEAAIRHLGGETVPRLIDLPVKIIHSENIGDWDKPYSEREMYSWNEALEFSIWE